MKIIVLFVFFLFVALARGKSAPEQQYYVPQRIVGGSVTTINQYPGIAGMLFNQRGLSHTYTQWCAGNILTTRAILSAAHCFIDINFDLWSMILHNPSWWRVRVGSTFANSGGAVHQIDRIVLHSTYNSLRSNEGDLVILRTATTIGYVTNAVAPVTIASATYNLADNQVVWAVGWGTISTSGPTSEQLRHVQVWTVNQAECGRRYGASLTANMLCSGWLDVGGRDQCQGDSGGPLYHSNVLVGVCSWGNGCAQPFYPGVNVRVSSYSNWIISTAQSL